MQGKLFALDYDFTTKESHLVEIRLHQPTDVKVLKGSFKDARDICYNDGVIFVAERGLSSIHIIDIQNKVTLNPGRLKTRADLLYHIRRFGLDDGGTVDVLRKRLESQLNKISSQMKKPHLIDIVPPVKKPTSICAVDKELIYVSDDDLKCLLQIVLDYNGVGITGAAEKIVEYPAGVSSVESLCVCSHYLYFAASGISGGLYSYNLQSSTIELLAQNSTLECGEVKKVCCLDDGHGCILYTDSSQQRVRCFNPASRTITAMLGFGQKGTNDGTNTNCSFLQLYAICSKGKTIFLSDVQAGTVKLVSNLHGTVQFLGALGQLYDSFDILSSKDKPPISFQQVIDNVSDVNKYIAETVAQVKNNYHMKPDAATNGPEGTVSKKTQVSLTLLENGMKLLHKNISETNAAYIQDVELSTLLTTVVENLHAVSHFKHETFTQLQYAQDFGTITKESLKRTTKWGAKYFTHEKSYYPVPNTSMKFENVKVMDLPPSHTVKKDTISEMKEVVERFRPLRQRTVRSETTKDKAGALPPECYKANHPISSRNDLMFSDDTNIDPVERNVASAQTEPMDSACAIIHFVADGSVEEVTVHRTTSEGLQDEYETDSEDEDTCTDNDVVTVTRSGRPVRAFARFDM